MDTAISWNSRERILTLADTLWTRTIEEREKLHATKRADPARTETIAALTRFANGLQDLLEELEP